MRDLKDCPMAMLMFHARQPFYSPGSLHGLYNQIAFLRQAGAVTVQCMAHTPALAGRANSEDTFTGGRVIARIGRRAVSDLEQDGNHVIVIEGKRHGSAS